MKYKQYPPPTGNFYAPVRLDGLLHYVVNELNAWPKGQRHILLEQLSGETRELAENHLRFLEGREHEGKAEPPRRPAPLPEPEAEDGNPSPEEATEKEPPAPMSACLALDLVEQAKAIVEQLPVYGEKPLRQVNLEALLNCSMNLARTCHERIALQEWEQRCRPWLRDFGADSSAPDAFPPPPTGRRNFVRSKSILEKIAAIKDRPL